MKVLVDTSIWIEYFRARPSLSEESLGFLSLLVEDDRAVTIYPIRTEVLSGRATPGREKEIREAFESLPHIDLDWNASATWNDLVEEAHLAHTNSIPVPGIVDRMILSAAKKAEVSLWTLDQSLIRLADVMQVRLFN